ncbi:hypothetical protein ABZT03_33860 [Streptomyces sp. NPDC005574]|uniref:hypothetical protein n=1 Tax=Streptomyces sp. NPDC005574 TaxID=3156891 RepID=UPI0033AF3BA1
MQRLQFFLSESPWEAELVNDRRFELLREDAATAPHDGGVIVIDDSTLTSTSGFNELPVACRKVGSRSQRPVELAQYTSR